MSLISLLQEYDGKMLGEDDDSQPVYGKLLPGLSKNELAQLQGLIPCQIPPHMVELLTLTRGIKPALEEIDFSGLSLFEAFEILEIFPHGLPIAADGCGNFWVVDLEPKSKEWGPIFYACHDPPVIVWQAKTFEEFVAQLISFASFEEGSPINLVHDEYAFQIWRDNPGVISAADAVQPGDPDMGLFVQSLPKGYQFIDMRRPRLGEGFSWGRFGPGTEIVRNGYQRIFAYRKPAGFFEKLFCKKKQ